jgi:hypothetical protein
MPSRDSAFGHGGRGTRTGTYVSGGPFGHHNVRTDGSGDHMRDLMARQDALGETLVQGFATMESTIGALSSDIRSLVGALRSASPPSATDPPPSTATRPRRAKTSDTRPPLDTVAEEENGHVDVETVTSTSTRSRHSDTLDDAHHDDDTEGTDEETHEVVFGNDSGVDVKTASWQASSSRGSTPPLRTNSSPQDVRVADQARSTAQSGGLFHATPMNLDQDFASTIQSSVGAVGSTWRAMRDRILASMENNHTDDGARTRENNQEEVVVTFFPFYTATSSLLGFQALTI